MVGLFFTGRGVKNRKNDDRSLYREEEVHHQIWSYLPALTRPSVMTALVVVARGYLTAFRRFPLSAKWSIVTELSLRLSSIKASPNFRKMDYQVSRLLEKKKAIVIDECYKIRTALIQSLGNFTQFLLLNR